MFVTASTPYLMQTKLKKETSEFVTMNSVVEFNGFQVLLLYIVILVDHRSMKQIKCRN